MTHLRGVWEPLSLGEGPRARAANGKTHRGQLDVLVRILPGNIRCEGAEQNTQWEHVISPLSYAFMTG